MPTIGASRYCLESTNNEERTTFGTDFIVHPEVGGNAEMLCDDGASVKDYKVPSAQDVNIGLLGAAKRGDNFILLSITPSWEPMLWAPQSGNELMKDYDVTKLNTLSEHPAVTEALQPVAFYNADPSTGAWGEMIRGLVAMKAHGKTQLSGTSLTRSTISSTSLVTRYLGTTENHNIPQSLLMICPLPTILPSPNPDLPPRLSTSSDRDLMQDPALLQPWTGSSLTFVPEGM
ncbi:hypothetical protein BDK51DRAFT_29746 [Blyttiomyces helicus]|uniref:Uncharacterized protein n=1 Tax=Blyttiomyces helicus TaxID=388810 RepID=A0A4P9WKG9_9FUNG|nr:hypothetical protein BDK51DRAFT_29746 [Blyttiomyces helicus]|eukprot:RKO92892.1 hypothetical protein BDK51DRAFT_29746 [Blyttiomyces helicus]